MLIFLYFNVSGSHPGVFTLWKLKKLYTFQLVMDKEAWCAAAVHGVQSWTWLSKWTELDWYTFHVNIFHSTQCISIKYHKSNNYLTLFWGNYYYSNHGHIYTVGNYKTIQEYVFWDATLSYHDIYFRERYQKKEIVCSLSLFLSLYIISYLRKGDILEKNHNTRLQK